MCVWEDTISEYNIFVLLEIYRRIVHYEENV